MLKPFHDTSQLQELQKSRCIYLLFGAEEYHKLCFKNKQEDGQYAGIIRKTPIYDVQLLQDYEMHRRNFKGHIVLGSEIFRGGDFKEEILRGIDLSNADLRMANFSNADLYKADLQNANLKRAIFSGANLRGTYLTGANLSCANFAGTDLSNTILSNLIVTGCLGNGIEIRNLVLDFNERQIITLYNQYHSLSARPPYPILAIGGTQYPLEKWHNLEEEEKDKMDSNTLSFWNTNKKIITYWAKGLIKFK